MGDIVTSKMKDLPININPFIDTLKDIYTDAGLEWDTLSESFNVVNKDKASEFIHGDTSPNWVEDIDDLKVSLHTLTLTLRGVFENINPYAGEKYIQCRYNKMSTMFDLAQELSRIKNWDNYGPKFGLTI